MTDAMKVKAVRKALGLNQEDFGKALKIQKGHISGVESGKKNLSLGAIELLKVRFAVSDDWWESGKGEMFLSEDEKMKRLTVGVEAAEAMIAGKEKRPDDLGLSWDEQLILENYRKLTGPEKTKLLSDLTQHEIDQKEKR